MRAAGMERSEGERGEGAESVDEDTRDMSEICCRALGASWHMGILLRRDRGVEDCLSGKEVLTDEEGKSAEEAARNRGQEGRM